MTYSLFDGPLGGASLSNELVHVEKGASFDLEEAAFYIVSSERSKLLIEGRVSVIRANVIYDIGGYNTDNVFKITKTGKLLSDDTNTAVYSNGTSTHVINKGLIKGHTGVSLVGSNGHLLNMGVINGLVQRGISVSGAGAEVVNTGTIKSSSQAAVMSGYSQSLTNDGLISGDWIGVSLMGSDGFLFNEGVIKGSPALNIGSAENMVDNGGKIVGTGYAIVSYGAVTIDNSGLISAQTAMQMSQSFTLMNSGLVKGDVFGSGFGDVVENYGRGRIKGAVELGSGEDLYSGGKKADKVAGDNGNDVLRGMKGNDKIDGGADDDAIVGGEGDDKLTGGTGEDTFYYYGNKSGDDKIMDFEDGGDIINVRDWGIVLTEDDVAGAVTVKDNGNVVISLKKLVGAKSGTITLVDFADTPGQEITLADFEHGPDFI